MNTENLRAFLQGDAVWVLGAIAVLLAVKAWRNSSWIQLFFSSLFLCCHCLTHKRARHSKSIWLVPSSLWD